VRRDVVADAPPRCSGNLVDLDHDAVDLVFGFMPRARASTR